MQTLLRCLDALLRDIQAQLLLPANDDSLAMLFHRLTAASQFLRHHNSATLCLGLCRDWHVLQSDTGARRDRQILKGVVLCRESWRATTADDVLRSLLIDNIRAAIDNLVVVPDEETSVQGWLQATLARRSSLVNAMYFLTDQPPWPEPQPPQTCRELLRWLLMLQAALARSLATSQVSDALMPGMPGVFKRSLDRCLADCDRASHNGDRSTALWQLQLLAGALLALGSMQHPSLSQELLRRHCQSLIVSAARAQQQGASADGVDQQAFRDCLRHALMLSMGHVAGCEQAGITRTDEPEVGLTLVALPGTAATPVQALLTVITHQTRAAADWGTGDWAAVSMRLYRLLVCLRLLSGDFVDSNISQHRQHELARWQMLIASLHASVDHCLQRSVVTTEDQHRLLALLRRLALRLQSDSAPDDADLLPDTLLLTARLGLRAQCHWQQLTLELDAVQQDFTGVSVPHVLAAGLHYLPGMGVTGGVVGADPVLPEDVLRELRLLLKGARILNVQRIESLVLVLIEVYQEVLARPAFAEVTDVSRALPRAHRSLCRMLDQAAAWQTPGNARRMINSLYACLERWRDGHGLSQTRVPGAVRERPAGRDNEIWRQCMATNRRLRKLVRHQGDLDSIRVLLLELLRSQEDLIRQQAGYGVALDAP